MLIGRCHGAVVAGDNARCCRAVCVLWRKRRAVMTTERTKKTAPEVMRPDQAAQYVGINRTYFYSLLAHGVVPSRYERGRRLIRRDDLDAFREGRGS